MTSSSIYPAPSPEETVCDTSVVRAFALVEHFDLLSQVLQGRICVPTAVFDPEERLEGPGVFELRSEMGKAERYWSRDPDPEGMANWSRIRRLWQRHDLKPIEMTDDERRAFAGLTEPDDLSRALGDGEAAVVAIAGSRNWEAAIDEDLARVILHEQHPAVSIVTSRGLLRRAVTNQFIESPDAEDVYARMRTDKGYRGPDSLWGA